LPKTREDGVIDASEDAFAHRVPMIVRLTANLWVELIDQIGGRRAVCVFDGSSDAIQEGSNILLGRLAVTESRLVILLRGFFIPMQTQEKALAFLRTGVSAICWLLYFLKSYG
jgi:hypothetical protein